MIAVAAYFFQLFQIYTVRVSPFNKQVSYYIPVVVLFICLFVYLFICLFVYLFLYVFLIYLYIHTHTSKALYRGHFMPLSLVVTDAPANTHTKIHTQTNLWNISLYYIFNAFVYSTSKYMCICECECECICVCVSSTSVCVFKKCACVFNKCVSSTSVRL